ncbi:MAG: c-type cytochrome [Pseudomonadota bacterium]
MTAQDIRFFQTFSYVLASLVAFTIFIYVLAKVVDGNTQDQWVSADPARLEAIEARTAPVGTVAAAGDGVTVSPTGSTALTFRDPPPAHGDSSHGGDGHGDATEEHHAEDASESHSEGDSPAEAVVAATESVGAPVEEAASGAAEAVESADDGVATALDTAEAAVAQAKEEVTAAVPAIDGSAIYNQGCNACHAAGIAGAPKVGDAAAWTARIAQGNETLYAHAINGWNAMPAKGGFAYLSDDQVKAAVDHMVTESQ